MESKDILKDLFSEIESLFGKVFSYNLNLLERCNDKDYEPTYNDIFDFYITSHAMSLLKNFRYEYIESPGILLNARCIIEGIAMKTAFKSGDFDYFNVEYLKNQDALIEYTQYKKFKDCYESFLIPEELQTRYEKAYKFFKDTLCSVKEKELKEISKSQVPFACDPKFSFKTLVEDNLGPSWVEKYSFLSIMIHPTTNNYGVENVFLYTLMDVVGLIKKEYSELPNGFDLKILSNLVFSSDEASKLIESIKSECTDLERVMADFKKNFGDNYVSDTFHKVSMTIQEMTFDLIFGLREQVKSKWKVLIELLSGFYDIYLVQEDIKNSFELLQLHDQYNMVHTFKDIGEDESQILLSAYEIYKQKYPNGVAEEEFNYKFASTTGYTVDENGKIKSLTQLVNQLAEAFKEKDEALTNIIKLNYVEAQMISHANGYMWYSNNGAWADVDVLFGAFNTLMSYICAYMSLLFNDSYKEGKQYKDKKTSNILKSASKHIRDNTKNIYDILSKVPNPSSNLKPTYVS